MFRPLVQSIHQAVTHQIAGDRDALAVVLRSLRDAEASGESSVFQGATPALPPAIQGLMARHAADEERHIGLVEQALAMLGAPVSTAGHVEVVHTVGDAAGSVFDADLSDPRAFAEAYLLVYAMERRLAAFLRRLEAFVAPVEPEVAALLRRICEDEERHITWCQVVAWHALDGDLAAWTDTKRRMIAIEAGTFGRIQAQNLREILACSLPSMPAWQRAALGVAVRVLEVTRIPWPVADIDGRLAAREWTPPGRGDPRDPRALHPSGLLWAEVNMT